MDDIRGIVKGVYPEGKWPYTGIQHAFIWVETPSLNYTEMLVRQGVVTTKKTANGRAVPYTDIKQRIKRVME